MKSLARSFLSILILVFLVAFLFVIPVMARSLQAVLPQVVQPTADELAKILLGIYGAIISLVFLYYPEARTWFMSLPHQGIVMLGILGAITLVYFGLSCTPFAAQLHIAVSCSSSSVFDLLQAFYFLAIGNQLTYLFAPTPK